MTISLGQPSESVGERFAVIPVKEPLPMPGSVGTAMDGEFQ
jgi:hypothetical protein